MDRILVLGRSGSGKSVLASKLGDELGLPVFHLDKFYWLPGWVARPREAVEADVKALLAQHSRWIIDGNYRKAAFEDRIRAADLIIVLDFGFIRSVWRVIKRNIIHWNKTRPDMQDDCVEKLDLDFIRYIWTYSGRSPELVLKQFPDKKVMRFSRQHDIDQWLSNV